MDESQKTISIDIFQDSTMAEDKIFWFLSIADNDVIKKCETEIKK